MYIIIAIIAFGLLIAVHEFGHFSAAKVLGIKVNEFSIGMGPAILKRQRGETFYALRCLPIGGYCAMEGEDEETDDPRAFTRQPGWKRLIVLCAGSFMNFILGFLLVLVVYVQAAGFYSPVIDSFAEGCPYEGGQALMAGDEIYSVDGHRTWFMGNVSTFLSRGDGVYDIVVIRDGEKVELKDFELVPVEYEGGMSYGLVFAVEPATFGSVLKNTWYSTMDCVRIVWLSLSDLVAGAVGLDQLTGVVGIVDMINDVGTETAAEQGFGAAMTEIAYLAGFIAVNLAVMNMLPIPGLDGGRVLFLLLNGAAMLVARRRIPARYEGYVHAAGLVLMLALMAVVMYNDIARIVTS